MVYVLCSYLVAQKIPINPNHSIYPYLYRQSTNGILPQWIQSARPLTIEQVLKSLNHIIESDKTNDNNRILAEQFLSEFKSPEDNGLNSPLTKNNKLQNLLTYNISDKEPHLLSIKNDNSSLWMDWSENVAIVPSNDNQIYFQDNISVKSIISKKISAYSQFSMNRLVWRNGEGTIESVLPPDTIDWYNYNNEWAKYFPEVKSIFWYNS